MRDPRKHRREKQTSEEKETKKRRKERSDEPEQLEKQIHLQVSKCTCSKKFCVTRVADGQFRFGDSQKLHLVRILRSTVMVRVGGGWEPLKEFLRKHDPCTGVEQYEEQADGYPTHTSGQEQNDMEPVGPGDDTSSELSQNLRSSDSVATDENVVHVKAEELISHSKSSMDIEDYEVLPIKELPSLKEVAIEQYEEQADGYPTHMSGQEQHDKEPAEPGDDTNSELSQDLRSSDSAAVGTGSAECSNDLSQPKPKLTFPSLEKIEKKEFYLRVHTESMEIVYKFKKLFLSTFQSLKDRNISPRELYTHLVSLGSMKPNWCYDNIIDREQPPLRHYFPQLRTSEEVKLIIYDYCCFFNTHVIELIIDKLGTAEDRANFTKYMEDFSDYARRRVYEYPSELGAMTDGSAKLFIILDEEYDNCMHCQLIETVCRNAS